MSYAELQVTTHYSFLRGASSPEELFAAAATLGISALGIVDRNSLAGIVRAHEAAKATGIRLIVGCRLDLQCGTSLLVYPTDRLAYARLCRLLTLGKTRAGKGQCHLDWPDVEEWSAGLQVILLPDEVKNDLPGELSRLRRIFGERAYCALSRRFLPDEAHRLKNIASAAAQARVPTIVTNDVLYHCPSRRMLQDVVTCIRLHTTIDNAGFQKERHADRFLKAPDEMLRLFPKYEEAVRRTQALAARCTFSLKELTYTYPTEILHDGLNAQDRLEKLTWEGAAGRYPDGLPDNVATQLRHELNLIERMEYAPYFLTVESIVRFARSKGIDGPHAARQPLSAGHLEVEQDRAPNVLPHHAELARTAAGEPGHRDRVDRQDHDQDRSQGRMRARRALLREGHPHQQGRDAQARDRRRCIPPRMELYHQATPNAAVAVIVASVLRLLARHLPLPGHR
jgi:error-prone DNA polymerase